MQYFILSNTIIIQSKKLYTIEPTDARHKPLLTLLEEKPIDEKAVQNLLEFKLSSKIGKSEIINGKLCLDGDPIPEPFHDFLLSLQNNIENYELAYNLYFSLLKNQKKEALSAWGNLILKEKSHKIYSLTETTVQVLYPENEHIDGFLHVDTFFSEKELQQILSKHFQINHYKFFKELILKQKYFSFLNFKSWLTFMSTFKDSDDSLIKFMTTAVTNHLSAQYYFLTDPSAVEFLKDALKRRGVHKISDFKKFFGSFDISLLSNFYNIERELITYQAFYLEQVAWNGFVTYQVYSNTLNQKLTEWRLFGKAEFHLPLNLHLRHPWLNRLKSFEHSDWGSINFLLPFKGSDLDMWSNTMDHCIRSYKEEQFKSSTMILMSLVTNEKLMLGTLELNYEDGKLYIKQFVGHGNASMSRLNKELHDKTVNELNAAISAEKQK